MTTDGGQATAPLETPGYGRALFAINAVLAWCAVLLSLTLNLTGYYVDLPHAGKPTILGNVPGGIDTPLERFFDWITYFTIWSNIVVAVVLTVLVARPRLFTASGGVGTLWRTLRLDSVLMIVITGMVYNLLLAEGGKVGWDALSNTLLHWVVPLVTPIVWIVAGPRGLLSGRVIGLALVLPLLWVTFALLRGQVVGAYPYGFLDVGTNGLASVLVFVGVIIVVAVLMALLMWAVDLGLRWTLRRPATESTE
jgi:hypothetical protein